MTQGEIRVPSQAIAAAAEAIAAQRGHLWDVDFCEVQALARAVLEAAAPHLAVSERERCAHLASDEAATLEASGGTGHRALRRFASLLRQDGGGGGDGS